VRGKLGANTFGPATTPAEESGTPPPLLFTTFELDGGVWPKAIPDKIITPIVTTHTLRERFAGRLKREQVSMADVNGFSR
jgi:hypothetical protein